MKNVFNAALLLRDDITTLSAVYDDTTGAKRHTFVVRKSDADKLKRGSIVAVTTGKPTTLNSVPIVTVREVHSESKIDLNLETSYPFVLGIIDEKGVIDLNQSTQAMAERIRDRQAASTREALLSALGLTQDEVKTIQQQSSDDLEFDD